MKRIGILLKVERETGSVPFFARCVRKGVEWCSISEERYENGVSWFPIYTDTQTWASQLELSFNLVKVVREHSDVDTSLHFSLIGNHPGDSFTRLYQVEALSCGSPSLTISKEGGSKPSRASHTEKTVERWHHRGRVSIKRQDVSRYREVGIGRAVKSPAQESRRRKIH